MRWAILTQCKCVCVNQLLPYDHIHCILSIKSCLVADCESRLAHNTHRTYYYNSLNNTVGINKFDCLALEILLFWRDHLHGKNYWNTSVQVRFQEDRQHDCYYPRQHQLCLAYYRVQCQNLQHSSRLAARKVTLLT
jgi:hypothetical protein